MLPSGRTGPPVPKSTRSREPSLPWTTARCQRLLRPLVSRIASLRKDTAATPRDPARDEPRQETRADTEQQSADDNWLRPRKKVRLTYSQKRSSRAQNESTRVKESEGADATKYHQSKQPSWEPDTPLLERARGYFIESPPEVRGPRICGRGRRSPSPKWEVHEHEVNNLERRLAELRLLVAPSRYNDLEAIFKSLEALLKATRHGEENQRRGPRSFLDMCLRAVPQYIEELEAWERMEAKQKGTFSTLDDIDTSTQIYDYLESIGPYQGWKNLRVVVRANGIAAVKQGIVEGLFGDDFSIILIDICAKSGALPEAKELLATFVDRKYRQPTYLTTRSSPTSLLPLFGVLLPFSREHDCTSFLLRQFSQLLQKGSLPQDWLASQLFHDIWVSATRCLTMNEDADDAAAFMKCAILLLCRRKRKHATKDDAVRLETDISIQSNQALTRALVMLGTMGSLGEMDLRSSSTSRAENTKIGLIGNRLRCILMSCIADLESSKPRRSSLGSDLLYLAFFLSSSSARSNDDIRTHLKHRLQRAWQQGLDSKSAKGSNSPCQHLDDIATFISSMARSYSTAMSVASQTCLDTLFGQLETLELQEILVSMKAAAAFSLAQGTGRISDFIYAERLASIQGPATADGSRYRWEGTIGEWVIATPVIKRSRRETYRQQGPRIRRSLQLDTRDDDSDAETRAGDAIDTDTDTDYSSRDIGPKRQGLATPETEHITKKRARSRSKHDRLREASISPMRDYVKVSALIKALRQGAVEDELSSDKENQNHKARKRPRRSVDRMTVLGLKARPSLTSRTSNSLLRSEYSDDELM
ncbi:hypothetical protein F5Y04DRAFT_243497 [Hypomontagnella monticulosa]|nr:hypothetical protein F5Y04DRAFT_243497 [Hypomontagnella monticulosa]